MSFNKFSVPVATYCVPVHDVQTVPEDSYDFYSSGVLYPSASAEYFSDPTEDPDFCDIIADLAQDELFDFSWGPSAVALPVDAVGQNAVSAVSIAVPESYVCPYEDNKGIVVSASAVDAVEEDFKTKFMGWEEGTVNINEDPVVLKKRANDQKLRRFHAVQRLKEKRQQKKSAGVAKSHTNRLSVSQIASTVFSAPVLKPPQPKVISARQAAAAHRERVNGKFKHNKTRWVSVTELMKQTHLRDQGQQYSQDYSETAGEEHFEASRTAPESQTLAQSHMF